MEGVGSRLGRASSRYGQAPVFSGPVRKWKKQWVQVSSPLSYSRSNSTHGNNVPSLLLCRWTPISSTNSGDNSSVKPEEPPRRKFRYTPIVVLDEMKKEFEKRANDEPVTSKISQSPRKETTKSEDIFRKQDIGSLFVDVSQELKNNSMAPGHSNKRLIDMDLCLKGDGDDDDSDGDN